MTLERILDHRVLFITGKGGIGKSLLTAVLGILAAKAGKKVCLVENSHRDQLAPLFGFDPVGHQLTRFQDNLFGINLDSGLNFRDFVVKHLGHEKLFEKVFNNNLVQSLIQTLPGLAEVTLLGRIYYNSALDQHKFDLVIFDGYSSGHFLNLITTPQAVRESGLVGPVIAETKRVIDYMNQAGNSGIVLVATPEPLVQSECVDFLQKFQDSGFSQVTAVIVNRYLGEQFPAAEMQRLKDCTNPDLEKITQYLINSAQAKDASLEMLRQALGGFFKGEPLADRLFYAADLGAIPEPLSAQTAAKLFKLGEDLCRVL